MVRSLGDKLRSHRVRVFEALAAEEGGSLSIPEIARIGRVPSSTAHRVVSDFLNLEILVRMGKRGKAPLLAVNLGDPEIVEACRALSYYTLRLAELDERAHENDPMIVFNTQGAASASGEFHLVLEEEMFEARPDSSENRVPVTVGQD